MVSSNDVTNKKCPNCNAEMVKQRNNDPLVMDRENYKCTSCGNEHVVYQ